MTINPKAIELAARMNKAEPNSVFFASDMVIPRRYTTGSLSIDLSLGGGWPANQWYEIFGEESHGKTAITLKTIAANQQRDPNFTTLWIASEHYDLDQATALGVDTSRVLVVPERRMEKALDIVIDFVGSRAGDAVVIDSYPALVAPEEDEKSMGDFSMTEGARLMGKFFRKMGPASKRDPHDPEDDPFFGIIINQKRDAVGKRSPIPGYTPWFTPGGNAKDYAYYARLEVKRADWIEQKIEGKGKTKVGQTIRTQAIKNKGGPPQRVASVDFYFTDAPQLGFSRGDYDAAADIIIAATMFDVIENRGSNYYYKDYVWKGKTARYDAIREDLGLQESLWTDVMEASEKPNDKRTWDENAVEAVLEPEKKTRVVSRRTKMGARTGPK